MLIYDGYGTSCFTAQQSNSLCFFDTVLANHLSYQLHPTMINRLCQTSGLGLVHCYLGAIHPYMAGNCFLNTGAKSSAATHLVHSSHMEHVALDKRFVSNIEHIAQRQQQGDLVSLSFAALRRSLTTLTSSTLLRNETGWVLSKPYAEQPVVAGDSRTIAFLRCDNSTAEVRNDIGYLTPPTGEKIMLHLIAAASFKPLPADNVRLDS